MSTTGPGQPEYLGPGGPTPPDDQRPHRRGGRRGALVAGAAVAVVAVVGVGGWAVAQLFAGGSAPASAVPATAIGYVSLDLDPSASQKIEAVKILRKFPSLRDELKISSRDDVRKRLFDEIKKESDGCAGLDYDQDVKPWIGERVAVAAVPGSGDRVLPLIALQVSDEDGARTGLRALEKCSSGEDDLGFAFSGDYALLTEKQADADAMAKSADTSALEDDADFSRWMDRAGDAGIVTMYASKDAVDVALRAQRAESGSTDRGSEAFAKAFKDFDGAVGVVRFRDGAVEAEFQTKGVGGTEVAGGDGPDVKTLPGTTAAVISLALKDGWLDGQVDRVRSMVGEEEFDSLLTQAEQQTGLSLPDDVETLLGDGLSISFDSSADLKALQQSPDPSTVPAGIRIKGEADQITRIVDRLKKVAGPQGQLVKVSSSGDTVAIGTDPDYVDRLVEDGNLGSQVAFQDVVPEADRSSAVLFVNFDAGDGWATQLADLLSGGDPAVKADIEPLDALGVSGWVDDSGVSHSLARLTTD